MTDEEILTELRRHAEGCCLRRWHTCEYHQGYQDGLDRAQRWAQEAE